MPSTRASESSFLRPGKRQVYQGSFSFVGNRIKVRITGLANRRRIVGSARILIEEEKNKKAEAFWSEVEEGKEYTGTVKSLTKFGAFVDLAGGRSDTHIRAFME